MARNQLMRILNRKDKGASRAYGVGGVLSRLWAQMLTDLDVNVARWNDYMHSFVTDPGNGYPPTKNGQTSARGNLTKEFSRPQMTFKVFMKALRFLKVIRVEIAIKCHYMDRPPSTHGTEVNFRVPSQPATTFMEDISRLNSPEPEIPRYSEEEDDEFVRDMLSLLSNPFMFPFPDEDVSDQDFEIIRPQFGTTSQPAEDFGGNRLAQIAYKQYLADKQQMEFDHEERS
jgi:hypothetical protein